MRTKSSWARVGSFFFVLSFVTAPLGAAQKTNKTSPKVNRKLASISDNLLDQMKRAKEAVDDAVAVENGKTAAFLISGGASLLSVYATYVQLRAARSIPSSRVLKADLRELEGRKKDLTIALEELNESKARQTTLEWIKGDLGEVSKEIAWLENIKAEGLPLLEGTVGRETSVRFFQSFAKAEGIDLSLSIAEKEYQRVLVYLLRGGNTSGISFESKYVDLLKEKVEVIFDGIRSHPAEYSDWPNRYEAMANFKKFVFDPNVSPDWATDVPEELKRITSVMPTELLAEIRAAQSVRREILRQVRKNRSGVSSLKDTTLEKIVSENSRLSSAQKEMLLQDVRAYKESILLTKAALKTRKVMAVEGALDALSAKERAGGDAAALERLQEQRAFLEGLREEFMQLKEKRESASRGIEGKIEEITARVQEQTGLMSKTKAELRSHNLRGLLAFGVLTGFAYIATQNSDLVVTADEKQAMSERFQEGILWLNEYAKIF